MYPKPSSLSGIFSWRITVNESRSIAVNFDDVDFEVYTDNEFLQTLNCAADGWTRLTVIINN